MRKSSKIIVSVTNDLSTDQRVHKVCTSLQKRGYEVQLVGRRLAESKALSRSYNCKRFRLWFNKGFLFYANYNLRLFFFLLFSKADILLANDLDTLPANYMASLFKRLHLVYDSHEYFTEVPELINRPRVQKVWENMEQIIVPKLENAYTVSPQIKDIYKRKYGVDFKLVRNFPSLETNDTNTVTQKDNIILYQGALNVGRGLEELILAMQYVTDAELWIAGGGDIEKDLIQMVEEKQLQNKVKLLGRLPLEQLKEYTLKAKIGVSLEKKAGLNYEYALPNKVFDYLHAGVPILYSDLEAVKSTLQGFVVGEELKSYEADVLAKQLMQMLTSKEYTTWVENCKRAKELLNWEKEEQTLFAIFDALN